MNASPRRKLILHCQAWFLIRDVGTSIPLITHYVPTSKSLASQISIIHSADARLLSKVEEVKLG